MASSNARNIDHAVVEGFGDEWSRFDQTVLVGEAYERAFHGYFRIFPWHTLPANAEGFDLGCGSGRWARGVAPRVGTLHCVDASHAALDVARRALREQPNVRFHHASVDAMPFADGSMDFGYSLGVLHHVPDTLDAIKHAAAVLKPGAPLLLYLYYAFDNQPAWYRLVWKASEAVRFAVSRAPLRLRYALSQLLAAVVYFPMARAAWLLEKLGMNVQSFPLSEYRHHAFYVLRTDALDRFGTRLEQRFTRAEIESMMQRAGLRDIRVSDDPPYWCAVGTKV